MSEVFDLIKKKRAIRVFTAEPIPEEIVFKILEAGRLSGSAKNTQPWHFVAIRERETLRALSTCGTYAGHLAGAALGVALLTEDPFQRLTIAFDLGRATQNMMLTASSLGIGSVMASIYQSARAIDILGAPTAFTCPWCISFGYPAEEQIRPGIVKGGRRKHEEVIHNEKW